MRFVVVFVSEKGEERDTPLLRDGSETLARSRRAATSGVVWRSGGTCVPPHTHATLSVVILRLLLTRNSLLLLWTLEGTRMVHA